jgi:tetratricopeptide (TPR) repeat protein
VLLGLRGDYARALAAAEESIGVYRQLQDPAGEAAAVNVRGVIERRHGDYERARRSFENAAELWRGCGAITELAGALKNLSTALSELKDYAGALARIDESIAVGRVTRTNDPLSGVFALSTKSELLREMGDLDGARTACETALAQFRDAGYLHGVGRTLGDLARIAMDRGDRETSQAFYSDAIDVYRKLDHRRGLVQVFEALAVSAASEGRPRRCLKLAGAAAALRQAGSLVASAAERSRIDPCVQGSRASLGPTAGAAAWMEGWTAPLEAMADYAVRGGDE